MLRILIIHSGAIKRFNQLVYEFDYFPLTRIRSRGIFRQLPIEYFGFFQRPFEKNFTSLNRQIMVGKRRQEVKTEKTELNDDGTGDSDNQFARYQFRTRNKTKEVDPVKDEAKTDTKVPTGKNSKTEVKSEVSSESEEKVEEKSNVKLKRGRRKKAGPVEIKEEETEEKKPRIETSQTVDEENQKEAKPKKPSPIKVRKPKVAVIDGWVPEGWELIYENIKKMRSEAPVDIMSGALRDKEEEVSRDERFYILMSLMMSARTNDKITADVMKKLREKGFNLDFLLNIDQAELAKLIKPVNFYKNKAKHMKEAAVILKEQFNGDIPKTLNDMLSLPGVGMKMSLLALQEGWGINEGLAVDTHVLRLANLFKWIPKPTDEAEKARVQLEGWVPRELWPEFNKELVAFGQTTCLVKTPKCDTCLNNKICPAAFWNVDKKSPKSKKKK